ncbi:MAG: hypothetical protein C4297_10255 [Gemmataceae bacterium]
MSRPTLLSLLILLATGAPSAGVLAQTTTSQDYPLKIRLSKGACYRIRVESRLEGTLPVPRPNSDAIERQIVFRGESSADYEERLLDVASDGSVPRTIRLYRILKYRRNLDRQVQEGMLRSQVRRLIVVRKEHEEVPFSPDGPLTWGEIDMVRTDVFYPALAGLLPDRNAAAGESWIANADAVRELTDLEKITEGQVRCTLQRVLVQDGKPMAQISLNGRVAGLSEDGPGQHQLTGHLFFDLERHSIAYLSLNAQQTIPASKDGRIHGHVSGVFTLTCVPCACPEELNDRALAHLRSEPDEFNTRLLFDEPALGLRFVYPRRWTVRKAEDRQVVLHEPEGAGLRITLLPTRDVPTVAQLQSQVDAWLKSKGARIEHFEPARYLAVAQADRLAWHVQMEGAASVLLYLRLSQGQRSAIFVARLPARSSAALEPQVVEIARTLELRAPTSPR